jgi:hypothetical protein
MLLQILSFKGACSSARLEQSALNRLAEGSNPSKPVVFYGIVLHSLFLFVIFVLLYINALLLQVTLFYCIFTKIIYICIILSIHMEEKI